MTAIPNPAEKPLKHGRLTFSIKAYPTFGRARRPFDPSNPPSTVLASPFYWWYEYAKLNPEYAKTCQSRGKGRLSQLYEDFGNVYGMDFKEWWRLKAPLFAEPKEGYRLRIARSSSELAPFDSSEVLNVVVPLDRTHRALMRAFSREVLKLVPKGQRGVSVKKSEASYRLSGKWHIEALATAHRIYTLRQRYLASGERKTWADISIEARLPMAHSLKKGDSAGNADVRRTLTILAKRHYERAEKYIAASITHSFPYLT
jgi:hypothetical protein